MVMLIAGCSSGDVTYDYDIQTKETYNESPDLVQKYVGTEDSPFSMLTDLDLSFDVKESEAIIFGEVLDSGTSLTEEMDPHSSEFVANAGMPMVALTKFQVKVDRVIFGEVSEDIITLVQMGEPGNDRMQTKVKKGQHYLLLLNTTSEVPYYSPTNAESSIYQISEDGKVMSLSNEINYAKYDDTDLGLIMRDLSAIVQQEKGVDIN